jgi:hypothetical protein
MKKWLTLALAIPVAALAGCGERAELAPRDTGDQGPVALRYRLTEQSPLRYRIHMDGKTTTATREDGARPTDAPSQTVQADFDTEMIVQQQATQMAGTPSPGTQQPSPGQPGTQPPGASDTVPPGPAQTQPGPGAESPPVPGQAREQGPAMTPGTQAPGQQPPATPPLDESRLQITQSIESWTANVQLPDRERPNQFSGTFSDGQLRVQAHNVPMPLPQQYRQPIEDTLQQPVRATVNDRGEVLRIEWRAPRELPEEGDEQQPAARQLHHLTSGSTGLLNLWFGMIHLPEDPVHVGDSWDHRETVPVQFEEGGPVHNMDREARYTLNGIEELEGRRVAAISVTETLRIEQNGASAADPGQKTAPGATPDPQDRPEQPDTAPGQNETRQEEPGSDLLQTRQGTVYFDIARGVLHSGEQQFSLAWDTQFMMRDPEQRRDRDMATAGQAQGTIRIALEDAAGVTPDPHEPVGQPAPDRSAPAPAPDTTAPAPAPDRTAPDRTAPDRTAPDRTAPAPGQDAAPGGETGQTLPEERGRPERPATGF